MLTWEQRQGFQDQVVTGGLEAFVHRWSAEAHEEAGADHAARVDGLVSLFAGYAAADVGARQDAVAAARARLGEMQDEGLWKTRIVARVRPAAEAPLDAGAPQDVPPLAAATPRLAPEHVEAAAPAPALQPAAPSPAPQPPPDHARMAPNGGQIGAPRARVAALDVDSPVGRLPGVGPAYAARLPRLGINTVRDLLYHFPRRYNDFSAMRKISQLKLGEVETIAGTVRDISNFTTKMGKLVTTAMIADETGVVKAVWFNQAYMINALPKGGQVVISGKVDLYLGRPVFTGPAYENLETEDLIHTGRLVPVYPLTHEVNQRWLRRLEKNTVDRWAHEVPEHLPASVLQATGLPGIATALEQIHFPDDAAALESARRRLAFDELMLIQLSLLVRRRDWRDGIAGAPMQVNEGSVAAFIGALPFTLTSAQRRALEDILADLARPTPMARLLQGDVGSGKTVVAAAAVRVALGNGMQAAVMAPTEILAEQHFRTFSRLLGSDSQTAGGLTAGGVTDGPTGSPVVRLLVGSQRESDKARVRQEIASGQVGLVVGTQTVIQESVEFSRLGLVVIDEQHRFGVMQRAALRQKGFSPHVLAMTATPIPRTLALTLYGDLDLSVIGEMPPGRRAIETYWMDPRARERAYTIINREIGLGHQAFVVCPLVEESDVLEAKAATDEYERLRTVIFPHMRLGLLHGRMRPVEKDAVMRAFRDRELDVLVSTPVIEVGIDIPNATVMAIESADRFGLSQLHQFRGRVGRGPDQSYCMLLSEQTGEQAKARLGAIERTQDGFALAEEDLRMRGPGEFFGVRQSGLPDLKVARLSDVAVLEMARAEAVKLFAADPLLDAPEHQLLKQHVARFWQAKADLS